MSKPSGSRLPLSFVLLAFLIGGLVAYFARPSLDALLKSSHSHRHSEEEIEGTAHTRNHESESEEEHNHIHESENEEEHNHIHESESEEEHNHIHESEDEEEHNHIHEHEHSDALSLNVQALRNIGLELGESGTIALSPTSYSKSVSFPGYVRYNPGRSLLEVPAPASGVITKIYVTEGEAVCPGEPLFDIQLTHEELVSCELELTSLLQKRDMLLSERERLNKLAEGIEPRQRREIELQLTENESAINAQKQALCFLGAPLETIEETLIQKRELLTVLTARAPMVDETGTTIVFEASVTDDHSSEGHYHQLEHYQTIERITVEKGQTVSLGDALCVIADLRELWIEGKAFESDEGRVNAAFAAQARVSARFASPTRAGEEERVDGLTLRSIANRLDPVSRSLSCYLNLKNYLLETEVQNNESTDANVASSDSLESVAPSSLESQSSGVPILNWRFKPGQRCELDLETETFDNVFVVPVAAAAQEGAETFLFEVVGEEDSVPIWHKRPVVVLHQTSREIVVANDGSIKEGAKIAKTGARQLYTALTNGGGKLQSACDCGDHDH